MLTIICTQPAVEGAAHDDAGEQRKGELHPAHRAAAG
jgi:hypothetical protein